MQIITSNLIRENVKADLESTRLLLKYKKYTGYCEYLSPISPISNSKKLIFHYKAVHAFALYRVALVRYLASRSRENASCETLDKEDGFHQNPPLNLELLHTHYELKKRILDDLVDNIPKLPVSESTIKRSIHKTLFRQYKYLFLWILGFIGLT